MIITDGMPDIYKDIFDEYNWRTGMRVRMFTFRIGDEETGVREMQWIACNNNGEKRCRPLAQRKINIILTKVTCYHSNEIVPLHF
jgi:hypothetical protein